MYAKTLELSFLAALAGSAHSPPGLWITLSSARCFWCSVQSQCSGPPRDTGADADAARASATEQRLMVQK